MRKEAAEWERFAKTLTACKIRIIRQKGTVPAAKADKATVPAPTKSTIPEYAYNDHLSPAEAAAYLGVRVGTLYHWNYVGIGPKSYRVNRFVRYKKPDLDAYILETMHGEKPKKGK